MQPGPLLLTDHPEVFWGLVASMYIGNVILLILNLPLVGIFVNLLRIPYTASATRFCSPAFRTIPNDLAVIGWNAAFLYDSEAGAETAIQLLEYANSQLLEFRHYDELLTRELGIVYAGLDKGTGMLARWRLARAATKLHTVLLDVNELTERADNAIKFLSDMFSARLYKLAAAKVGVPDYKDLVTQKLQTAEDLYRFMVDQFNQSRAFVLELMVVIILVIELVFLFGGKL